MTPYYIVGCANCKMIKHSDIRVKKCNICDDKVSCEKITSKSQLKDKINE